MLHSCAALSCDVHSYSALSHRSNYFLAFFLPFTLLFHDLQNRRWSVECFVLVNDRPSRVLSSHPPAAMHSSRYFVVDRILLAPPRFVVQPRLHDPVLLCGVFSVLSPGEPTLCCVHPRVISYSTSSTPSLLSIDRSHLFAAFTFLHAAHFLC